MGTASGARRSRAGRVYAARSPVCKIALWLGAPIESILRLDSESQLSEQECNDAFRAQVTKWSPAPDELACDYWAKIARRRYQQLQIAGHTAFCETRHFETHTIDIHC